MERKALIAGLGNPGTKYRWNRHNAGFLVLDALAEELGSTQFKKESNGESLKISYETASGARLDLILFKPMQFMNLSGAPLCPVLKFHQIPVQNLLVIHDEIELPFGDIRMKTGGGHKGHNGLRDIIAKCGSPDFHRLRMGVGRPEKGDVAGYVLSDYSKEERNQFHDYLGTGISMCREWLNGLNG